MSAAKAGRVRRRRLFYVGGFDPASARKSYGIFTEGAARQASLAGGSIQVGPLEARGDMAAGWSVEARHGAEQTNTDYEVLLWHDIVRKMWPRDRPALFVGVWTSLFDYFRSGIMAAAFRDAPLIALASAMPAIWSTAFLLAYVGAVGLAGFAGAAIARSFGWPGWVGALPALLLVWPLFIVWRWADRFVSVAWLARGMICVAQAARGDYPELDGRCEAFARRLIDADQAGDVDEILVVGHSMGAQLAGQAVAKAMAADPNFGHRSARVNLLTLGQLIPFYSLLTQDAAYRREMRALADAWFIGWVDFTSPADAGSAAMIHPLQGVTSAFKPDRPVRRSPRFHALLSKAAYSGLRRRPLDYHFAYLKAMDVAGDYDFFRLTTGPDFLTAPAYPSGRG